MLWRSDEENRKISPKEQNFFICPDLSMRNSYREHEFFHASTTLNTVKPMTMKYLQFPGTLGLGVQVVTAGVLHHSSFYNMHNRPLFFHLGLWLLVQDNEY